MPPDPTLSPDPTDAERLLALVYDELRSIARYQLAGERPDHTLVPTGLVHEAWIRLGIDRGVAFASRDHFLRFASTAMRHVLVDHARARGAAKRGGGLQVTLTEAVGAEPASVVDVLALDAALERLAAAEPRWARVVELRFFAGLEVTETAALLEVSPTTVKRDWRFARTWLARELDLDAAVTSL